MTVPEIDRDELVRKLIDSKDLFEREKLYLDKLIKNDKHGRWRMYSYDEAVCTICNYTRYTAFESTEEAKAFWGNLPPYCENCGAKMDGEI